MSMLILDTNIVSYLLKGNRIAESYRPHLEGHTLAISFVTIGEMFEGAFRARWGEKKIKLLESELRNYLVVPYFFEICLFGGQIRYDRRKQPMPANDAWIAATAIAYNCPLVTHNSEDFRDIETLQVITTAE
jgi:tRNA(fMet)-specific endonuclease VapC